MNRRSIVIKNVVAFVPKQSLISAVSIYDSIFLGIKKGVYHV